MNNPVDDNDLNGRRQRMLALVKAEDPDGAEKLEKRLGRKGELMTGNTYGECFTERQFSLVFDPLLERAVERSRILENLRRRTASVPALAADLGIEAQVVFEHMKELARRDLVEIAGYESRDALYRRK